MNPGRSQTTVFAMVFNTESRQIPLSMLLVAACCVALGSQEFIEDTDRFPGWKGELPNRNLKPDALDQKPTGNTVGYGELGKVCAPSRDTSRAVWCRVSSAQGHTQGGLTGETDEIVPLKGRSLALGRGAARKPREGKFPCCCLWVSLLPDLFQRTANESGPHPYLLRSFMASR